MLLQKSHGWEDEKEGVNTEDYGGKQKCEIRGEEKKREETKKR